MRILFDLLIGFAFGTLLGTACRALGFSLLETLIILLLLVAVIAVATVTGGKKAA